MASRLTYIDIARGICIILVVVGHFIPAHSPQWFLVMRDIIYCFHMPLFMFVSGFVYQQYKKPTPYKAFITKKFKRLIIPYFLISIFIICTKLLVEKEMYVENPVDLHSFYQIFYLPSAGFYLWFVYVLFLIFLIIPFFNTPLKLNILFIASFLLLILPVEFTDLFCLNQFKGYLFYFVLGCFTSLHSRIREYAEKTPLFIKAFIFIALYSLLSFKPEIISPFSNLLIKACLGITGISFIIAISRLIEQNTITLKKIFTQLAVYSFTIYLFHTTFQGLAKSVLTKIGLTEYLSENTAFIILILTVNSMGIIGPIILYLLDQKREEFIRKRK